MSEQKSHNVAEIEALLATRQQLTGWLERLDSAGSRAPESVRAKVRADYHARQAQVVAQLGTHADLIASTLDGLRAQSKEFRQSRGEELAVRAEAELRHTVGEYSDNEWQLVELESSGKIEGFDQEIDRLGVEIRRLEEVQDLIAPPAPAPPAPPQVLEHERDLLVTHGHEMPAMLDREPLSIPEQPALTLVKDEPPAAAPRPEAPRFVPRGGTQKPRESGPVRSIPFPQSAPAATPAQQDELAFLRSVTLDSTLPGHRITQNPAPNAVGGLDRDERPSQTVSKTLKCGECGSLNRPTEWYCERCGAELAAL
jgi:hypothetical protein